MADAEKQGPHPNAPPPEYAPSPMSPQPAAGGIAHPAGPPPMPTSMAQELPTPTPAPHPQGPPPMEQQQMYVQQPFMQQPQMMHGTYAAAPQPTQQYYVQQPGGQPIMTEMPGNVNMTQQPGIIYAQAPMMQQVPQQPGLMHPSTIPGAVPMVATGPDGTQQIIYQIPKQQGVTVTTAQIAAPTPQLTTTTNQHGKTVSNPNNYQTAIPLQALNISAAPIDCPNCNTRAITSATPVVGASTHLWAMGFCFFLLMPCIPYLIDSFKDTEHKCSNCGVTVARYKRGGGTQVMVFP